MINKVVFHPYKSGSKSVQALKKAIPNSIVLKLQGSKYKPKPNHLVVNWGSSNFIDNLVYFYLPPGAILNVPAYVKTASNKLSFYKDNPNQDHLVPWTINKEDVLKWLNDGKIVFARTKLTGHSGEGIIKLACPEDMVVELHAPLYTLYKKKIEEYRVHVFRNQVIDVVKKLLPKELVGKVDYQIRTHTNGWIFAREGVTLREDAIDMAIKHIAALKLDFGAVDMIYNAYEDRFYILEVNTAPGLEGTTVSRYADAIQNHMKGYF